MFKKTTKQWVLILLTVCLGSFTDLMAQSLSFAETKQMLTDYRWSLRRLEQDGQMYNVPEDMRGLVRVFLTNGMTYSFVPSDNETEAEQHKYSITKTHMTFYIYDDQMTFAYRIEDFIGYKLYMDVDNNGDIVTFVFDRAAKNVVKPVSQTVTIGSQVWSAKNLSTTTFRNGDPITQATTLYEWRALDEQGIPAYCDINFDASNRATFDVLYNYYAVIDPRGLAPVGWHIPSVKEAQTLIDAVGGQYYAAGHLKAKDNWSDNSMTNNSTGFSAVGSGRITNMGYFGNFKTACQIWIKEPNANYKDKYAPTIFIDIQRNNNKVEIIYTPEYYGSGKSVRLVKD